MIMLLYLNKFKKVAFLKIFNLDVCTSILLPKNVNVENNQQLFRCINI
jgi:hypothetical protein